jgi:lipopolysaccharide transport system ATP-binding protein
MNEAIRVEKLTKQYKLGQANPTLRDRISDLMTLEFLRKKEEEETLWALRDISLTIQHGETVGIIGKNGAGKSTLLKVLSKITYPTSGSVAVDGRVISLLEVGTGFHDELTGRENIFLNGSIMGMSKKQVKRQFDAIVEYSGVERFIDTPIKRFSSGMRLRLGFAVAAHLEPDILIVDEVLAVGDAAFQKKCLDTIQHLRSASRTILFVSHNLSAVEHVCDRCIWIDSGKVRMDGDTRTVIRDYMESMVESSSGNEFQEGTGNRRGTGQIQFTGVEFLTMEGAPQKITRSGDPIVIRLRYHVNEPVAFPSLGFRLYTDTNLLVTETSTWHHGIYIDSLARGKGYLDLEIGCLNLLPAKYTISLWATDMRGELVYDNIEHAVTLDVQPASIYQSDRNIDNRCGIVYFPQKWNLSGTAGAVNESTNQMPGQCEPLPK